MDLKNTIIVDNTPSAYSANISNGLPILTWNGEDNDQELYKIIPLLEALSKVNDVREVIPKFVKDNKILFNVLKNVEISGREINASEALHNYKNIPELLPSYCHKLDANKAKDLSYTKENLSINSIDYGITGKVYDTPEKVIKNLNEKIDNQLKSLAIGLQKKLNGKKLNNKDFCKSSYEGFYSTLDDNNNTSKDINSKYRDAIKCFDKFEPFKNNTEKVIEIAKRNSSMESNDNLLNQKCFKILSNKFLDYSNFNSHIKECKKINKFSNYSSTISLKILQDFESQNNNYLVKENNIKNINSNFKTILAKTRDNNLSNHPRTQTSTPKMKMNNIKGIGIMAKNKKINNFVINQDSIKLSQETKCFNLPKSSKYNGNKKYVQRKYLVQNPK